VGGGRPSRTACCRGLTKYLARGAARLDDVEEVPDQWIVFRLEHDLNALHPVLASVNPVGVWPRRLCLRVTCVVALKPDERVILLVRRPNESEGDRSRPTIKEPR
jgi:hypothetical protein